MVTTACGHQYSFIILYRDSLSMNTVHYNRSLITLGCTVLYGYLLPELSSSKLIYYKNTSVTLINHFVCYVLHHCTLCFTDRFHNNIMLFSWVVIGALIWSAIRTETRGVASRARPVTGRMPPVEKEQGFYRVTVVIQKF